MLQQKLFKILGLLVVPALLVSHCATTSEPDTAAGTISSADTGQTSDTRSPSDAAIPSDREAEATAVSKLEDPGITALRETLESPVLTRSDWGANEAVLPMIPHKPRHVTIHHTAVKQNRNRSLVEKIHGLQEFSQKETELWDGRIKEVWADIPYHYYIAWDGSIAEARDVRYQGDSNTDYDLDGKVQIVLEGNFQDENVTDEQYTALFQLTSYLMQQWSIPVDSLSTHGDHAETLCPGLDLTDKMEWLRQDLVSGDMHDGIISP